MTSTPELAQLEMLAQADELIGRLTHWTEPEFAWEPLSHCRSLMRRVLQRVETLRIRLEAPLVVATFGGTGTGKSALVNAIVGRDCTVSGRQRPTTLRPVLVAHPRTELDLLDLPLDQFEIVKTDSPALRDIVIIDCPDPDTNEAETAGSNLERLHQLLPHCDVLIYTSTQQKYRSARVVQELATASVGCRLIFVQTYADLDEDIRDDWRRLLSEHYDVPDVFFVDSLRALREQQASQRPTGDFGRLQDLLSVQLGAAHRTQIRRANLLDLIQTALDHCRDQLSEDIPGLTALEAALEEQRQKLIGTMAVQLRDELLTSRNLWERRLISAVTQKWGFSPFSSVLRLYNGLGNVIASATLFRARNSAQVALIGALQGARWFRSRQEERDAESRVNRVTSLGLDDAVLRQAHVVIAGYAHGAKIDSKLADSGNLDSLRHEAERVEDQFLGDAGSRVDEIIRQLSRQHSGVLVRWWNELLLGVFLAYLLVRVGKNFFWDSAFHNVEIMTLNFYVPAVIFLGLWAGMLVMLFTRRLRRGLDARIHELAQELALARISTGLFPQLEQCCRDIRQQRDQLEALSQSTSQIRRKIALASSLGTQVVKFLPAATAENLPA